MVGGGGDEDVGEDRDPSGKELRVDRPKQAARMVATPSTGCGRPGCWR